MSHSNRFTNRRQKSAAKTKLKPLTRHEYDVDDLCPRGRGLATGEGGRVHIAGALAGERVLAQHGGSLAADEAQLLSVERLSPSRREARCEHFGDCGGCQLQHLDYPEQLAFKTERLWQGLRKLVQAKTKAVKPKLGRKPGRAPKPALTSAIQGVGDIQLLAAEEFGYRRRARFGVSMDGQLGFRRAQSNDTLPLAECPVLSPALAQLHQTINTFMAKQSSEAEEWVWHRYIGHVEFLDVQPSPLVIIRVTADWPVSVQEALCELAQNEGFRVAVQERKGADFTPWYGELHSSYELMDWQLQFQPGEFIQVNDSINQKMVSQALDWLALAGTERVLDLFCGVGNFSIPLAASGAEVLGLELSSSMTAMGMRNAQQLEAANLSFSTVDLEEAANELPWLKAQKLLGVDAVVLDPPRAGAKTVLANIIELSPAKILYVSCNEGTLLRDLKQLGDADYRLQKLAVMDMFPNTEHVECMALLSRPGA